MSDKRLIYNALQKSYRDGRDAYDFFRGGYEDNYERFIFALVFYSTNRNGSEKTPAILCNGQDEPCAAVCWRRGSCIQSDTVAVGCMNGKYIKEIAI